MLEIKICGEALDLHPDITLTLSGANPFLADDAIPMPYTYPVELPPTARNLRILETPDRIAASSSPVEKPCEIWFDGFFIDVGVFVVEDATPGEMIRGHFKGAESNSNFETPMNELTLDFNETYVFDDDYCARASRRNDQPVVFAPIKLIGDVKKGGPVVEWRDYINYYVGNGHFLRDIFPAIRIGWLLDRIFGPALVGNPFRYPPYSNIVLQTLQHTNYTYPGAVAFTKLADYLPGDEATKVVKDILRIFCASVVVRRGKYDIVFNRDVFNPARHAEDWSGKIATSYKVARERGKYYKYGYNDDRGGNAISGWRQITYPRELLDIGTPETDGEQVKVLSTGQVVSAFRNGSYDIADSGFGGARAKYKENHDVTVDVHPMNMVFNKILVAQDLEDTLDVHCPQIGVSDIGSDTLRVMMYHGICPQGYPLLSSWNHNGLTYSGVEVPLSPFHLGWNGDDGLIETFHKDFKQWIEKDKKPLDGDFLLNAMDVRNIDYTKRYYVNGRYFYIQSYEIPITVDRILPAEVKLIEA